jgi:hypothetical protein
MELIFNKSACKISQNDGVVLISPNSNILRFLADWYIQPQVNKPNVNFYIQVGFGDP